MIHYCKLQGPFFNAVFNGFNYPEAIMIEPSCIIGSMQYIIYKSKKQKLTTGITFLLRMQKWFSLVLECGIWKTLFLTYDAAEAM